MLRAAEQAADTMTLAELSDAIGNVCISLRRIIPIGIVLALLMPPSAVRANGRFPAASQLVVDSEDPRHFVARTTFGLIRSFDGGANWSGSAKRPSIPPVSSISRYC